MADGHSVIMMDAPLNIMSLSFNS